MALTKGALQACMVLGCSSQITQQLPYFPIMDEDVYGGSNPEYNDTVILVASFIQCNSVPLHIHLRNAHITLCYSSTFFIE